MARLNYQNHGKGDTTPSIEYYLPDNLFDLEPLFPTPDDSDTGTKKGFPRGSSILLMGPPGSGKTIFALGLVRALMKKHADHHLYYLSSEHDRSHLQRQFRTLGWFAVNDEVFKEHERAFLPRISVTKMDRP